MFTREFHRSLVRFHWSAAMFVPGDCLDDRLYMEMLLSDPNSLQLVPEDRMRNVLAAVFINPQARIAEIVRLRPQALPLVPERLRRNILLQCIVDEPDAVQDLLATIPSDYLDYDVCLLAIQVSHFSETVLECIPSIHRTREICKIFIEKSDSWLEHLPSELRSDNMCLEMALVGHASIDLVPQHLRTQEVYERVHFRSLAEIPADCRSDAICSKAVRWNGDNIAFVPKDIMTDEMILQAVMRTGTALRLIPPERMLNPAVVATALSSDPAAAVWAPEESRNSQAFRIAAERLIGRMGEIPDAQLSEGFIQAIVAADGRLLIEVPLRYHTPEICEIAFRDKRLLLSKFPDEKKSRGACLASVRVSWRSLRRVPISHLLDGNQPDISEAAILNGPCAFRYVPIEHPMLEHLRALAINTSVGRGLNCGFDD